MTLKVELYQAVSGIGVSGGERLGCQETLKEALGLRVVTQAGLQPRPISR